jgi:hypothetical protein
MRDNYNGFEDGVFIDGGNGSFWFTPKAEVALRLRVPRSGDPGIDAMIRESRRADIAQAVITGAFMGRGFFQTRDQYKNHVRAAFLLADAMLAEWEKEAEK